MIGVSAVPLAAAPLDELEIIVPSSPGGGWDQTARAMKEVLEITGAVRRVRVVNSPGAGGVIGLAQFVNARRGEEGVLLVGGAAMVGAIGATEATISLGEVTAIARLTSEHLAIAVPAGSPLDSLEDLLSRMQLSPGSVAWVGGSSGGLDNRLVEMLAQAAGVAPFHVIYVPRTGGGKVAETLLAGQCTAGVSGYGEFAPYFESGQLRALALSSDRRLPGVGTPTLRERGINLVVTSWRGIFAPPGVSDEWRRELLAMVDRMAHGNAWGYVLRRHHWKDAYLPGQEFSRFVHAEEAQARVTGGRSTGAVEAWRPGLLFELERDVRAWVDSRTRLAVLVGLSLLLIAFAHVRSASARRESRLSRELDAVRRDVQRRRQQVDELQQGLGEEIERQFSLWRLTTAEREVARLLLKGLKHREIAEVRRTSERTARQQALSVYKKAGLDGRTDLAAYFLEDLLLPVGTGASRSNVA